jgi:transposase-like protein
MVIGGLVKTKLRLTDKQKGEIRGKLKSGARVADVAKEFGISIPTAYKLRNTSRGSAVTAVQALEAEIATAESRLAELLRSISEADLLRDAIKSKKAILESLKKLEGHK